MGDYISTARRHGKEWFVGLVYDEPGGTLDIKLDFLEAGKNYKVTYYEDTKETHYKANPKAYQVRQGIVKKLRPCKGNYCSWKWALYVAKT